MLVNDDDYVPILSTYIINIEKQAIQIYVVAGFSHCGELSDSEKAKEAREKQMFGDAMPWSAVGSTAGQAFAMI